MDLIIAPSGLPLLWQGNKYKVLSAGIASGVSHCSVHPKNDALEKAIIGHLSKYQAIKVYWKVGHLELCD